MEDIEETQPGRWLHWPFGLVAITGLAGSMYFVPALRSDVAIGFATITGFATLYGVTFAIIEVLRLQSVTKLMQKTVRNAERRIHAMTSARNITECQSCIEYALDDIDKTGRVNSASLSRISKFYTSEFAADMIDDNSVHRAHVSMVTSYIGAIRIGNKSATGKLRGALADMMVQLSTKRIQEREEVSR